MSSEEERRPDVSVQRASSGQWGPWLWLIILLGVVVAVSFLKAWAIALLGALLLIAVGWFFRPAIIARFSPMDRALRRAQTAMRQRRWQEVDHHVDQTLQAAQQCRHLDWRRGLALAAVADIRREQTRYAEAEKFYQESIDILGRQKKDPRLFHLPVWHNNLAENFLCQGHFDLAAESYRRALATGRGEQPLVRAVCLNNLAAVYFEVGLRDAGKLLLAEAEGVVLPDKVTAHLQILIQSRRAELELETGEDGRAESLARSALEAATMISQHDRTAMALPLTAFGKVCLRQGRFAEARQAITDSLKIQQPLTPREPPKFAKLYFLLAQVTAAEGDDAKAEEHFRHGWKLREEFGLSDTYAMAEYLQAFAALLRRTGRNDEADSYEQRARQAGAPPEAPTSIQEIKTLLAGEKQAIASSDQ